MRLKLLCTIGWILFSPLLLASPRAKFTVNGYADAKLSLTKTNYTFSLGEFSPILQFEYNTCVLFHGNPVFTIQDDGTTKVDLNYATFNYLLGDNHTITVGKFLSPLGQFRQYLRPAWINKHITQPVGFSDNLSVQTQHHLGIQLRGGHYLSGHTKWVYTFFISNGPELVNNVGNVVLTNNDRVSGSGKTTVTGGRVGLHPGYALELNISGAYGKTGLGEERNRTAYWRGADFLYHDMLSVLSGFDFRGEYIDSFTQLTEDSTRSESAWYLQSSYLINSWLLEPTVRYSFFRSHLSDSQGTQTASQQSSTIPTKTSRVSYGINYIPYPSVIFKVSYNQDYQEGLYPKTMFLSQIVVGF